MNNYSKNTQVICPRCYSDFVYKFGKNKNSLQKYQCQICKRQFVLEKNKNPISKPKYGSCPICNRAVFAWHRYGTYIHFKCCNKKCNHSFKVSIAPSETLTYSDEELIKEYPFKGYRHSPRIILLSLTLYFDAASSTRAIKRFLKAAFNISVSHVTIHNWTKNFADFFFSKFKKMLHNLDLSSDEWHADETIVKIKGIKHYLWVLIDSETRVVIAFHLSPFRNSDQAHKLFSNALDTTSSKPKIIITDQLDSYNQPIATLYPDITHYPYKGFLDYLNNNFIESFNKTFKAWYKVKKGFKSFNSAQKLITTFIYYYNFIHQHSSLNNLTPALVAGANYSYSDASNWLIA